MILHKDRLPQRVVEFQDSPPVIVYSDAEGREGSLRPQLQHRSCGMGSLGPHASSEHQRPMPIVIAGTCALPEPRCPRRQ
jgi:hypothetical protein